MAHYTAKIHLGHETGRNPVLQRVPARQSAMLGPWLGWRMHFGQLKRREFITLLGGFGPVSLPLFQAGRSGLAFDEEGLLSFMVSLRSAIIRIVSSDAKATASVVSDLLLPHKLQLVQRGHRHRQRGRR